MPDASTLVLFAGASLALLAIPGPAVIYVVTRSWLAKLSGGVSIGLGVTAALSGGGHARPSHG
jgi:threonine/homoserine/homoserine lactone efflux protein